MTAPRARTAKWPVRPEAEVEISGRLSTALGIPPLGGVLLAQRGIESEAAGRQFLEPSVRALGDPAGLSGLSQAAERIERAIGNGEKIVVHGDYDVDGISGAALLISYLRGQGADVQGFVPDRLRDGYGIASRLVRRAGEVGVDLIVTVDCGSTDDEAVLSARASGIDVVVTDHHEMTSEESPATVLVNPKQAAESYPFRDFSGAGLAFKLVQGLIARRGGGLDEVLEYIDLAALGTMADVVPLTGENRIIASLGIARLADRKRPGIAHLLDVSGARPGRVSDYHVTFVLAPRLNAPGRIAKPLPSLELLLATEEGEARRLARRLEEANRKRKELDERVTSEAEALAEAAVLARSVKSFVFASAEWHEGVIGIAAARLARKYEVPTVLIALRDGVGKASCRSIPGLDLVKALESCRRHLVRFGGHRAAAGFSIREDDIDAFRESFEAAVESQVEGGSTGFQVVADVRAGLAECDLELARFLEFLSPFGPGNPRPLFLAEGLRSAPGSVRIVGKNHLKTVLVDEEGRQLECIGFGWADKISAKSIGESRWDLLFHLKRQVDWDPNAVQGQIVDLIPSVSGDSE